MLLFAVAAQAQEETADKNGVATSVTEDAELRYRVEDQRLPAFPDRPVFNYFEQVNRTIVHFARNHANANGVNVTDGLSLQIDEVALFANRYVLDGTLTWERQLTAPGLFSPLPGDAYGTVEKLAYTRDTHAWSLTVGDAYGSFGRGIAFDMNRNVDIDQDSSIQGVKAIFRPGAWDVTVIGGLTNRQQVSQDLPNIGIRPDTHHAVLGVAATRYGVGPANLGAHAVAWDFVQTAGWKGVSDLGSPDVVASGATAELSGVLGLDTYLEGDGFYYLTERSGGNTDPGYALYGSTTAYLGPTTWQLEGKRYKNTEHMNTVTGTDSYRIAVPPTLEYERVITEDSGAAVASNDIVGGRLRVDWAAIPVKLVPYASIGVFRDNDTTGIHFNDVPETIFHPVLGVEAPGDEWSVIAAAGWRVDDRDGKQAGFDRQIHGDLDLKFPIAGRVDGDLAASAESFHWGVNEFQQHDYVESETALTLQYNGQVSVVWYTDYSTNPILSSSGNLFSARYDDDSPWYGAGEVQVKASSAVTVKAFYGAYKAGIRCSGGQCRQLPGFKGGKLSVNAAF